MPIKGCCCCTQWCNASGLYLFFSQEIIERGKYEETEGRGIMAFSTLVINTIKSALLNVTSRYLCVLTINFHIISKTPGQRNVKNCIAKHFLHLCIVKMRFICKTYTKT